MLMFHLVHVLTMLIKIYSLILIMDIIASWLVAFNAINTRTPWVAQMLHALYMVTDPPLRFIRKYVPPVGGLDFAAVILLIALQILERGIWQLLIKMVE